MTSRKVHDVRVTYVVWRRETYCQVLPCVPVERVLVDRVDQHIQRLTLLLHLDQNDSVSVSIGRDRCLLMRTLDKTGLLVA